MLKSIFVSLLIGTVGSLYAGSSASSITLNSSANTSVLGQPLTLTATVTPSSASGKVTFYSGVTMLGIRTLASGQAVLTTRLLPAATTTLRAYYTGDSVFAPGLSAGLSQTIRANPAGAFQNAASTILNNPYTHTVVADLNDDGKADLVLSTGDGKIDVFLGNGDGTFGNGISTQAFTSGSITGVATGDFNGDGKTDVTAVSSYGQAVVFLGNGDGTLGVPVIYPTNPGLRGVGVADFNGDGIADIVYGSDYNTSNLGYVVTILPGNGDGSFRPALAFPAVVMPAFGYIADFNNDGRADLVVSNFIAQETSVFLGNGDGTVQKPIETRLTGYGETFNIGDFNGDGKPDLVIATETATETGKYTFGIDVLIGKGNGIFETPTHLDFDQNVTSIEVADVDGDGNTDLAIVIAGTLRTLLGDGQGHFRLSGFTASGWTDVVAADFNGDGTTDLAGIGNGVINMLIGSASNLLVNPGAENGLNGWWADNPASSAFSQGHSGARSFQGSHVPYAFVTQTIYLSKVAGITPFEVDSGSVLASYSFWFQDPNAAKCVGQITLTFYDQFGWSITGQGLSPMLQNTGPDSARWINGAGSFAIPPGTRMVNYTMDFLGTTATNDCLIDDNFLAINQRPTGVSVSMSSSRNPAFSQESVILTAKISDPVATGIVTFLDGSSTLGATAVTAGTGSLSVFALTPGAHSLTAVYSKDPSSASVTSAVLTQNITPELVSNPVPPVTPLTTNVLVNPGAEGGMANWYPDKPGPFAGSPGHTESSSFQIANGASGFVTQTVSLANVAGLTLAAVDSGILSANYSYWLADPNADSACYGLITLTFLDETASQAVGQGVSAVLHPDRSPVWLNGTGSFAIPAYSRYINYTMDFLGSSCAFDDNVLTISRPY